MLVDLRLNLDLPEDVVEGIVGRADDGSEEWHQEAGGAVQSAVQDEPPRFLEYVVAEQVEVL